MRIPSGMARRTPSRACSSKLRSDSHIGRSGDGGRAALASSGSVRLRQEVPTKTTTRPPTHPAAMCAAAQGTERARRGSRHGRASRRACTQATAGTRGSRRAAGARRERREECDRAIASAAHTGWPPVANPTTVEDQGRTGGGEREAPGSRKVRRSRWRRRSGPRGPPGASRGSEQEAAERHAGGEAAHHVCDEAPRGRRTGRREDCSPVRSESLCA